MLGLRWGSVRIIEHQNAWEDNVSQIIKKLIDIFADKAVDIQHIGSTAIDRIKAKPIIDIAVGIDNFYNIDNYITKLEKIGVYKSNGQPFNDIVLFSKDDHLSGFRTHNIQLVIFGSKPWREHILFRNYMNAFPDKAKEYEELK